MRWDDASQTRRKQAPQPRCAYASQLIAAGMDVLSISRRLGHGLPSITLDVYGHLFHSRDDQAAAVFEKAFGSVLTE